MDNTIGKRQLLMKLFFATDLQAVKAVVGDLIKLTYPESTYNPYEEDWFGEHTDDWGDSD